MVVYLIERKAAGEEWQPDLHIPFATTTQGAVSSLIRYLVGTVALEELGELRKTTFGAPATESHYVEHRGVEYRVAEYTRIGAA
ncbi:hypothetical protein [Actinoallomurus sp. NPDC052274]|uniref:hypothetical protein n=1 Tax=Actinoallomurus sp. NPDC052274 TaxID=3155420 RepID=UPI003429A41A